MRSKKQKKNFKYIDILRVIACLSILFYHLNIIKGGYLAVCTFFLLSGYLSCKSALKKEKFSILAYYKNRFFKVYVPLIIVVFLTVSIFSFFPNVTWLNLKTETTSILLGFNNFWQLNSNLDYFARSIHSPFIHFWYLSILLQFDLLFPFLFLFLKKIGKKVKPFLSCAIPSFLAVLSFLFFYKMSLTTNLVISYYNTFARSFSWLIGISICFIHEYYGMSLSKNVKKKSYKKIFWAYASILVLLFLLVDASSLYYSLSMGVTTFLSLRMLEYATLITTTKKEEAKRSNQYISLFSNISYAIYLVQYPVIFLFQYTNLYYFIKIPLILIVIAFLSTILYFCLVSKTKPKKKIFFFLKKGIKILILLLSIYGVYVFVITKNYTLEMKELEEQLAKNAQILEQKQEEYKNRLQEEENDWAKELENLETQEEAIDDIITALPVVGVGDSVMLGAVDNLYQTFPNGYFDAQVSRSVWKAKEILQALGNKGLLKGPIVLNLGANGDCTETCKKEIIETCKGEEVFWLTVTNDEDVHINQKLQTMKKDYENVHIIDWATISKGHEEYFYADGIHLTGEGRRAYTNAIYTEISKVYVEKYKAKKEEMIKEHEEKQKAKISFYGNNLLLNAFQELHEQFPEAKFNSNQKYTYEVLKNDIESAKTDNTLNYKVVFVLDKTSYLSSNDYKKLIELCSNNQIFIVAISKDINQNVSNLNYENVTLLNFYEEIEKHPEYVREDGVHLTEEGNKGLSEYLVGELNKLD